MSASMSRPWYLRLRNWLIPDALGHGWMPFAMLGYLLFLFLPFLLKWERGPDMDAMPFSLGATLLSVAAFLPLYVLAYRSTDKGRMLCVFGMLVIACVLFRWNGFSNNYVVYCASFLATLRPPLWQRLLLTVLAVAIFGVVASLYPVPHATWVFIIAITLLISVAVFFAVHFQEERDRKQAALALSHDEVKRVAAFAERERIGRDLHDLLGHTLSTVALKAELAGKLMQRDPALARKEIDDVAAIARDALSQVRAAVTGMRNAAISAELASAKMLLHADGIDLDARLDEVTLKPDAESALAMSLREAVTNVQRHAHARRVDVQLAREADGVSLRISDDGRGGPLRAGNGLSGMRERLEALGGSLDLRSDHGTTLIARLPSAALT